MRFNRPNKSKNALTPKPQHPERDGLDPLPVARARVGVSPMTLPPSPSITLEDFTLGSSGTAEPISKKSSSVKGYGLPLTGIAQKRVFGEDDVIAAFQGIAKALRERCASEVEIRVFGSGAMICSFPGSRRLTTDIDIIPSSPTVILPRGGYGGTFHDHLA